MADEAHIQCLLAGKTIWNNYRTVHDFQPDFRTANLLQIFRDAGKLDHNKRVPLNGFDLRGADFFGANLSQVDFQQANLRDAIMIGAHFVDANFHQADLTRAKIGLSYLSETSFSCATLKDANLIDANLIGTDLDWSRFWQARIFPNSRQSESSTWNTEVPIEINSVAELIERCFAIREHYKDFTLYFRGERDCTWKLSPSVMRPSDDGTFKLRAHEGEMLRDLIAMRPEDFTGMGSALEQIVIAQHHGLKTRLLDVSHNPCVALFAACDSRDPIGKSHDNKMDGRIHVFAVPKELVKSFDSDIVSIVCNFAKLDRGHQNLLVGKNGEDSKAEGPEVEIQYLYPEAMRHLYGYIQQEKPHFKEEIDPVDLLRVFVVEPKQSFQRIRAQRGAFVISAFHERFEKDEIRSRVNGVPVYEHETLIVPCKRKEIILEELSLLGFTRETLYPSLDEVANRITSNYL